MINIQVRAKSGLHSGATWVAKNSFVTIGANGNSDVFLCDSEIPDTLLTLRRFGRRYQIETIHPEARVYAGEGKATETSLFAGQVLTLDFKHIQLEIYVQQGKQGWGSAASDKYQRFAYAILQLLRNIGAKAIVAILFLISLGVTTYILFFGSVGTVKAEATEIYKQRLAYSSAKDTPHVNTDEQLMSNIVSEITSHAETQNIRKINILSEGSEIQIDAVVSRAQMAAFENKLIKLAKDYGQRASFKATLKLSDEQMVVDNIEIQQLLLGEQRVAILNDGERLYEGGQYNGLTVNSIDSSKVILTGTSKYEIII